MKRKLRRVLEKLWGMKRRDELKSLGRYRKQRQDKSMIMTEKQWTSGTIEVQMLNIILE